MFFLFLLGLKRDFGHFVLHVKRRRRGPEVKQPFDLYWQVEFNFGEEPVFLEASVLSFSPLRRFEGCIILEKWFPLQGERGHFSYFWSFQKQNREEEGQNKNNRLINLPKVITFSTDYKYTT